MRTATTYLILLISLWFPIYLIAQETEKQAAEFEVTMDLDSRYVWRGYDLSHKDPVALSYIHYSPKWLDGFRISAGTIWGLVNDKNQGDSKTSQDEFDVFAAYKKDLIPEKFSVTLSVLFYKYTSPWTKTFYGDTKDIEAVVDLEYTVTSYFVPLFSYYRGLDQTIKGNYFEAGFSSEFTLIEDKLKLTPYVYGGYSMQYEFKRDPGVSDLTIEIPMEYSMNDFYGGASLNFTRPMRRSMNESSKDFYYWGLYAGYSF